MSFPSSFVYQSTRISRSPDLAMRIATDHPSTRERVQRSAAAEALLTRWFRSDLGDLESPSGITWTAPIKDSASLGAPAAFALIGGKREPWMGTAHPGRLWTLIASRSDIALSARLEAPPRAPLAHAHSRKPGSPFPLPHPQIAGPPGIVLTLHAARRDPSAWPLATSLHDTPPPPVRRERAWHSSHGSCDPARARGTGRP